MGLWSRHGKDDRPLPDHRTTLLAVFDALAAGTAAAPPPTPYRACADCPSGRLPPNTPM
ncbi:hypothetical protein GCM10022416_24740 [Actinomadura keratinilytica]|uniref:Uncharacterized protein n=1 Tax=Actinomadura keratinilytica TaxID=547461 RepID=A0ABP7YNP2_9ACTN